MKNRMIFHAEERAVRIGTSVAGFTEKSIPKGIDFFSFSGGKACKTGQRREQSNKKKKYEKALRPEERTGYLQ